MLPTLVEGLWRCTVAASVLHPTQLNNTLINNKIYIIYFKFILMENYFISIIQNHFNHEYLSTYSKSNSTAINQDLKNEN